MTNAEIFRSAAQYIREHGHEQAWSGRKGGPGCSIAALRWGSGDEVTDFKPLWRLMRERLGLGHRSIPEWNMTATAEKVIALFNALADDEELKSQIAAITTQPEPVPVPA